MADRSTFLFLSFLFSYYPPFISASLYDSTEEKEAEWNKIPPNTVQLYMDGLEVKNFSDRQNHLPKLHSLNLSSRCIKTLPDHALSDLKKKCLKELVELSSNRTYQGISAGCACEFIARLAAPPNGTACAEMLEGCARGSAAMPLGVCFLVLLVLCGAGCAWRWSRRGRVPLAFPRFLQRRSSRRRDYSKALSVGPHGSSSRPKVPGQGQGPRCAAGRADPGDHYENLEAARAGAREAEKRLYENTRPSDLEEHVYGNQASPDYCNLKKPGPPEASQEEDIYILPDPS